MGRQREWESQGDDELTSDMIRFKFKRIIIAAHLSLSYLFQAYMDKLYRLHNNRSYQHLRCFTSQNFLL